MTRDVYCADDSIPTESTQWDSSWPRWLSPSERGEILSFWADRFAVPPAAFIPYELASTSRVVYLIRKSPHIRIMSGMAIQNAGLAFTRKVAGHLKPTTAAAQLFGHLAKTNMITLENRALVALCRAGELKWTAGHEPGYVFLRTQTHTWGCGLYLAPGRLLCRLPKSMRNFLAYD